MIDEEGMRWLAGLDAPSVDEITCWRCDSACAAAYFFIASKNENPGFCSPAGGGVTGIIGIPKAFFTAGFLITEKINPNQKKKEESILIKYEQIVTLRIINANVISF